MYLFFKYKILKSTCPTKLGELIATNTPITNSGIGDTIKFIKN